MIRCPTCGLDWSPGTLTCPKDGTRLSAERSIVETLTDEDPSALTARSQRPTPLDTSEPREEETSPHRAEPDRPAPVLDPPSELRSGDKRASFPPEPRPSGRPAGVGTRPTRVAGERRTSGAQPAFDAAGAELRPRSSGPRPVASPTVQPLPVARNEKNPWGDDENGTDSTHKRVHSGPKTQPAAPQDAVDPLIGVKLGEYTVLDRIGSGGMGIVYRGEQPLIGKQVAIKVLRPELASDPRQVQRLVDEARAVNAVHHPGLINIFSFGETPDGAKYFVMDLLEGQSLEERLIARGRLKTWEVLPILEGVCSALDAAHGAGVIHRDLKPSNIFLVDLPDHTHLVKLLDFGLAKVTGTRGSSPQTMNVVVGTPEYMSPEQARALEVTPRTDLYAMGIVAYELLTGNVPFSCESAVETLMMQLDVVPKPPGDLEPSIPEPLEKLVMRLLAKRPEDRPASATEVKRELVRIKRQLTNAETLIGVSSASETQETEAPTATAATSTPSSGELETPLPPGTRRFDTTEGMAPVDPAEHGLKPQTERMHARGSGTVPVLVALGAALVVLLAVGYLGFMRKVEVSESVVVPPPPPPVARPRPEPPLRVVEQPPPQPTEPEPAPPPVVKRPDPQPVRPKSKSRTKAEVVARIDRILARYPSPSKLEQTDRTRVRTLQQLKEHVEKGDSTPEQAWHDVDPLDPTR